MTFHQTHPIRYLALSFGCLLVIFFLLWRAAFADVTINPASGGSSISTDTVGTTYTPLSGPTISENITGDVGLGTIILNIPAGFEFRTTANSVTATVTDSGSGCNSSRRLKINDGASQIVTPTSNSITILVTQPSSSSCRGIINWSGIAVRPLSASYLASGDITKTGTSIVSGVTDSTNFGTLTETQGAPIFFASAGTPDLNVIIFTGLAFPGASITIKDNDIESGSQTSQKTEADSDGIFKTVFVGVSEALHSFALIVRDKNDKLATTNFFTVDTRFALKKAVTIQIPPTIEIKPQTVRRGDNIIIFGYAAPNHNIYLDIDNITQLNATSSSDGFYKISVPSGSLNFGKHDVKANQSTAFSASSTDLIKFSAIQSFNVSTASLPTADFNGDGVVDAQDLGIFFSRFISTKEGERVSIDVNSDGKTNISDFSILLRVMRKK